MDRRSTEDARDDAALTPLALDLATVGAKGIAAVAPERVPEVLRGLSPVALVALEVLAEAGGALPQASFTSVMNARAGVTQAELEFVLQELERSGLALRGVRTDTRTQLVHDRVFFL
ncbi:MAG: hypothetical protein WCJ30_10585, partial [Deltaproteobacteria bacterium]